MRALIVDDSSVMRKVVEREVRLADLGVSSFLHAKDGREGLDTLRALSPGDGLDLILADINMPVMNGLEFLKRRLQEGLAPGVPVVMITTEENEPLILRAISVGALAYICKPFSTEVIRARLLPILRSRR